MSKVLVVDDLLTDRRMVSGLLERTGEITVEFSTNGVEALEKITQEPPDIVVTDLMMPEMDGLELVRHIRQKYPLVPVILMTSKGSEEIAAEALRRGAASYVPKSALSQDLVETVKNILELKIQQRNHARLMEYMTSSECNFTLSNDRSLIAPLVGYLQACFTLTGLCDDTDRVRVGVALEEALVNALLHGNLEVSSELRERDDDSYNDLIQQRLNEEPYRDRKIHVHARMERDKGQIKLRDEGPGFNPSDLPDPTDPANLEKPSGRGVLLMRTFMDEVDFNNHGNEVTLTKFAVAKLEPAD